jgi:hypothetical protein
VSDRFDELLDKVLREESAVEPLAGLEQRVLARVSEAAVGASRRWRMLVAGGLGVAAAVVALIVLLPRAKPVTTPGTAVLSSQPVVHSSDQTGSLSLNAVKAPRVERVHRVEIGRISAAQDEKAALPKLDVFPSPAPVDVFPRPVGGSGGEDKLAAAAMKSEKVGAALMDLQKAQDEPVRVAAIQIAPLEADADVARVQ